jgi:hypothetical protein
MPPATAWRMPAKSFGVDERRSLSGPCDKGAPAHRARELRIAPLGRLSSDVRVSIHEQAAGERRGEGEPELDRRQAPSHPQPLCGIDRLAHRSPPVDCRPYDFWWAMTPTISGAATGSGQCAPTFAVKCPHSVGTDASLDGEGARRATLPIMRRHSCRPWSTRPSDRSPQGRDQREGPRAGSAGDGRATTARSSRERDRLQGGRPKADRKPGGPKHPPVLIR